MNCQPEYITTLPVKHFGLLECNGMVVAVTRTAFRDQRCGTLQAEAFATLVQMESLTIQGAVKTITALLKYPEKRVAAITMMGKTAELCYNKVHAQRRQQCISCFTSLDIVGHACLEIVINCLSTCICQTYHVFDMSLHAWKDHLHILQWSLFSCHPRTPCLDQHVDSGHQHKLLQVSTV